MSTDDLMHQAATAVKAGRDAEARQLLIQILKRDGTNETAWLWLSGVVETDEQRIACLERVLALNPSNRMAQRGLKRLQSIAPSPSSRAGTTAPPRPSQRAAGEMDPGPPASSGVAQGTVGTPPATQTRTSGGVAGWQWDTPDDQKPSFWDGDGRQTDAAASLGTTASGFVGQGRQRAAKPLSGGDTGATRADVLDSRPVRAEAAKAKAEKSSVDTLLRVVTAVLVVAVVGILGYLAVTLAAEELPKIADSSSDGAGGSAEPQWREVASRAGRFYCVMPGTPKTETQSLMTMVGELELHTYMVERDDDAFMVGYTDYPASIVRNANIQAMLDGARDGAVKNVDGRLVGERHVQLQGNPGRELWVEGTFEGRAALTQLRMYLVGTRLYQTLVAGSRSQFSQSEAETFLNSFILVR